ncbi:Ig-like domain-containing protein, partial [Rhodococcus sp. IEGM 1379]|uniref:Ig-like domain-containing protein n=1 Tax=Rhodococcus sp. IEGM 1379 TaxID=3047086 RepID=UPI0024B7030E
SAAGTVSFKVAGSEIGTAAISNGVATLAHTFASAGAEVVTADFLPAAGFVGSSASAQTVTVSNLAPVDVETSLVLVVPAAGTTDVAVDLTATVTPANAV